MNLLYHLLIMSLRAPPPTAAYVFSSRFASFKKNREVSRVSDNAALRQPARSHGVGEGACGGRSIAARLKIPSRNIFCLRTSREPEGGTGR